MRASGIAAYSCCCDASGYTEGRERGLHHNADHWTLLMQIDSNEDLGMMRGDCGRLYLWITQEDFTVKAFEKSWLILRCGEIKQHKEKHHPSGGAFFAWMLSETLFTQAVRLKNATTRAAPPGVQV